MRPVLPLVQGTRDGGFGRGPGIAAGEQRERFGHRAAWRCGGMLGLRPWHGGKGDPLCQHLLGRRPVPGLPQGHIPQWGSAIPPWLIVLGSWWGSGGAGHRGPVGRAPRHHRLMFLRVMFLFLIPFTFSPALPPSSISSASVTSSVASELHGAVMEPDILLNKRVFFLWKPGCLLCAFLLPQGCLWKPQPGLKRSGASLLAQFIAGFPCWCWRELLGFVLVSIKNLGIFVLILAASHVAPVTRWT